MDSMKIQGTRRKLSIATPAKINLFFELLGKRDDGFHEVETVMSTVSLFDQLDFSPRDDGEIHIEVRYADELAKLDDVPTDKSNLIYKALEEVRQFVSQRSSSDDQVEPADTKSLGADIVLQKRIPSAAGLGGASSNAMAAIVAASQIWDLDLSEFEMRSIAAEIGSDVPFFLDGGMAVCRGRGELIELIEAPDSISVVVAKPAAGLSTAKVYAASELPAESQRAAQLMSALAGGELTEVGKRLFNRLEPFAAQLTPDIAATRHEFEKLECLGHQMSGSGTSYFGIFKSFNDAERAAEMLSARLPTTRVFCCRTLGSTSGCGSFLPEFTTRSPRA